MPKRKTPPPSPLLKNQSPAPETEDRELREALARLNAELENRVAEQTAEIRKACAAAGKERQRFNDLLEMLPACVVLLAPDYHVPFANRFFRERFGESGGKRCFE